MTGTPRRRHQRTRALILAGLLTVAFVAVAASAEAQPDAAITGPTLTLNPTSVRPGETATVIFTGWQGRLVTLSVCGNGARRGSVDCNLSASQGVRLSHVDDTPISDFVVSPPPGTCPCVIRATSIESNELATAPIEIIGHPVGPIVAPARAQPFEVSIDAEAAPQGVWGALGSALAGPTPYEVTVTVRNPTTRSYANVSAFGSVGRSRTEDVAGFDMDPFAIGAGQTWTATTNVTLPAPTFGSYIWRVAVSGGGPVVTAEQTTRTFPWLAAVLVLVLLVTLCAMIVRRVRRRRRGRPVPGDDVGRGGPAIEGDDVGDEGPTSNRPEPVVGPGE